MMCVRVGAKSWGKGMWLVCLMHTLLESKKQSIIPLHRMRSFSEKKVESISHAKLCQFANKSGNPIQ